MKVRFYLHSNKTSIYMDCRYGRESYAPKDVEAKARAATGVQLTNPESLQNGVLVKKTDEKDFATKKSRLNKIESLAYAIGKEYEVKNEPLYPAELKRRLESARVQVKKAYKAPVVKDITYYWNLAKQNNQNNWSSNTLLNYNLAHLELDAFQPGLTPADITPQLVKDFFYHLNYVRRLDNNSLSKYTRYLRALLKAANLPYEFVKSESPSTEDLPEPHTWEEIMALWKLDLKKIPKPKVKQKDLAKARDRYVFVCLTGPRFSDTILIDEYNVSTSVVDGETIKVLRYRQKKNQAWATIALHPIAIEIIERYQGMQKGLLPYITKETYNKYIKEIGEKAGLNRPVKKVKYIGKERIELVKPLYEVMSSHFARASWATSMLDAGMDIMEVQKAGGWKDLKTVLKYARVRPASLHRATLAAWERLGKV